MQHSVPHKNFSLFVAANRLPYTVVRQSDDAWNLVESPGGLVSALKGVDLKIDWVGWVGNEIPETDHQEIRTRLNKKSAHFSLHPVFLNENDKQNFYNGFSNQMIWPNFHDLSQMMRYSETHWNSYREVNEKFARQIFKSLVNHHEAHPEEKILIWIHDYQLMLVPSMLRSLLQQSRKVQLREAKIGFFLHIPFPGLQVFRHFPENICVELIDGLLSTDLFGVHEQSYLENFIENVHHFRAGCIFEDAKITRNGRATAIGVYPVGIDPQPFEKCLAEDRSRDVVKKILKKYADQRFVLGVDRLDPSKGLIEKMEGFAEYLESNPEARGTVSLLQVAVPSRTDIENYKQLKEKLSEIVYDINETYAVAGRPAPIELLYRNFTLDDLAHLYQSADALLVTSLKDGMNLVSFEFTVCQAKPFDKMGALILSQFAGAASYLHGALMINPFDKHDISTKVAQGLKMATKERESRLMANLQYVKSKTASTWAQEFIEDLQGLESIA